MNLNKKCKKIDSLLGDLSHYGKTPIPNLVFAMRRFLVEIEIHLNEDYCVCLAPAPTYGANHICVVCGLMIEGIKHEIPHRTQF